MLFNLFQTGSNWSVLLERDNGYNKEVLIEDCMSEEEALNRAEDQYGLNAIRGLWMSQKEQAFIFVTNNYKCVDIVINSWENQRQQDALKTPLYYESKLTNRRLSMSNSLISHNQLAYTKHQDNSLMYSYTDELMDDYFECLIDCDDSSQTSCRRVCSDLLRQTINLLSQPPHWGGFFML